ncbi:hypothetical protein BDN72DRAFT_782954, partial [Pluteus cervinus]
MSFSESRRSKEAPMDFQWTNRPSTKPVWAAPQEEPSTPRKRPHNDLAAVTPTALDVPRTPTFGGNNNVPFLFQPPQIPQTPTPHTWAPPPGFSAAKIFPRTPEELHDVDMNDASPPKPEANLEGGRAIATGGLRRVYKGRTTRSRSVVHDDEDSSEDESAGLGPLTQNTSNHYTLNMPSLPAPQTDLPLVLLGYLQFFFNLSLVLVFLYLILQFILTIQRDVEQRISEYSMDIVQEIAMCASQYKNNLCATNVIPAMARQCSDWEVCMNRDPTKMGRAKVGAEMIAEVVNSFVEPISWKTLGFSLTSLSFLTIFINGLLSLYRTRSHSIPAAAPIQPPPVFPVAPATPYHPPQSHHFGGYLSPAPTPSWGRTRMQSEDPQTPTRRRRIEGGAVKIK